MVSGIFDYHDGINFLELIQETFHISKTEMLIELIL